MDWVTSFFEQHFMINKFNQSWVMLLQYPDFARFNQLYSQVMHWWGLKEMKAIRRMIVPVFAVTLLRPSLTQRIPITDILLYVKNLLYFDFVAE
jgi:hypothetical protein